MTTEPTIRPATAADWPAIWRFFHEIVQAQETYAYPLDLTSDQARDLWLERPPGATVVLEEDGCVLGSARMGPNRPGAGAHIGTASFMVDGQARGQGVGRRLDVRPRRAARDVPGPPTCGIAGVATMLNRP